MTRTNDQKLQGYGVPLHYKEKQLQMCEMKIVSVDYETQFLSASERQQDKCPIAEKYGEAKQR